MIHQKDELVIQVNFWWVDNLQQQPEQSIHDFLFEIQSLSDQMALSESVWDSIRDAKNFVAYKDGVQVYQLPMALNIEFEAV